MANDPKMTILTLKTWDPWRKIVKMPKNGIFDHLDPQNDHDFSEIDTRSVVRRTTEIVIFGFKKGVLKLPLIDFHKFAKNATVCSVNHLLSAKVDFSDCSRK